MKKSFFKSMAPWAKAQIEDYLVKNGQINHKSHEIDGYRFQSGFELKVYIDLKRDPEREIIEVHPKFELFSAFKRGPEKFRPIVYTADFKIFDRRTKHIEIWEIKSKPTAQKTDYCLRKKIFLMKYPDIYFREIVFDGKKCTEKVYEP